MFRTELPIAPAPDPFSRTARVLTLGSCFADSIGSRLAAHKVDTLVNPFGTVFQPLALGRLLRAAAGEDVDWQQHLVEARGRWQSYDLHGSIGADSPVELLQTIQELVQRTGAFLRDADALLLTLGTAWAYRLRETGELVSNCHKQPADLFVRELLTPDEIINGLAETHAYLRRINPKVSFVLTVSPVRHLKDTLPLNSVSKSVLRVATHFVSDLLPGVAYFPAYELLVDDLRDYRFYAADMLHPTEVAEEYIWDKFAQTYFDAEFGRFRKEWAAVRQSLGHRPLHAGAPEHRQFLESTLDKLEQLSLRKVGVTAELQEVRAKLAALPLPRQPEPVTIADDDEERVDIEAGTGAAPVAIPVAEAPLAPAEDRPARLSPEEFRAQRAARAGRPERGRRGGHGRGQAEPTDENEQFQASAAFTGNQPETQSPVDEKVPLVSEELPGQVGSSQDAPQTDQVPATATSRAEAAGAGEEPAQKKKRRSRGGAKRTARKNALRLAAGELTGESGAVSATENAAETPASAAVTEGGGAQPQGSEPAVIAQTVPVKRSGRRNEPGRIPPTEPLGAAAIGSVGEETTPTTGADLPVEEDAPTAAATPVPASGARTTDLAPANASSRTNRSRNKGGRAATEAATTNDGPVAAPPAGEPRAAAGTEAVEATSSAAGERNQPERPVVPTASPVSDATPQKAALAAAPAPAVARQSNRAKRAVSAGRAEKPAIDTPVVPVPDASQVRTQVAAGRMTGTSATLVEPTAPLAKAAGAKKTAAAPKAAANKPKATKAKPVAAAPAVAPTLPSPLPTKPKPAAKPKAATKASVPPTLVAKPKPAAKAKAAPAKPAGPGPKVAPSQPAPKPKPPRKPAKPA